MSPQARMLTGFAVAIAIAVVTAQLVVINRPAAPPLIQGVLLSNARVLEDFTLLDHHNREFSNAHLKGRWHLVSYGFTNCPDVCPTTLVQLASVTEALRDSEQGLEDDLRVLFYTVDHRRDTVEQMAAYVPYFHPDFIGLTHADDPDNPHLPFESSLGIAAQLLPNLDPAADPDANEYEVSHGVTLFLVNPEGELQAILEPDRTGPTEHAFDPEKVLRDYVAIRDYLG